MFVIVDTDDEEGSEGVWLELPIDMSMVWASGLVNS